MSRSGRNGLGGEQTWGPEHKEMAAVSKKGSVMKSFDGDTREADPASVTGKADDVEEETGMGTPRDPRDRGPGTQALNLDPHLVPRTGLGVLVARTS
jgi:hypothetical protein